MTDAGDDVKKKEHFCTVGGSVNSFTHCGRQCGNSSRKQKQNFYGIYPKEYKYFHYKNTCMCMFTAALFTIAKTWNQPKCPSMREQIKKMCIYTIEYHAAIKKNEIMSFAGIWMELEVITLNKLTQEQKTKYLMFSLISGS